jgi:trehalose 6-phosphate phosphatase
MLDIMAQDMDIKAGRMWALAQDCARWALFIDIDGTLLDIAPTPDAVHVPPHLVELLERLVRGLDGSVALLTGRRVADADRLLAPLRLVASGVHGTELRAERGGSIRMLAPKVTPEFVQTISQVTALSPGILVEQKGAGVAVHYRNAPEVRELVVAELKRIVAGARYDVALRRGRKVIEAVPSAFSKATALTWLAGRPPFKGRVPIMIGDDAGDESAFAAAEKLGGIGLSVAGEHFSRAAADFDGVASVHAWLADLASRLEAAHQNAASLKS